MIDSGLSLSATPAPPAVGQSEAGSSQTASNEAVGCPNCGSRLVDLFCANCGERQPSHTDYSLRHICAEAYGEFVNVDGRLWRSIVALLSRPGLLATEYFAGRRGRYLRPFSLFVLLNVAFFFVQPNTGLLNHSYSIYVRDSSNARLAEAKREELALSRSEFEQQFDRQLSDQKKSLLLVAVPLFALALTLLYAGSDRQYVEHLVFSVHAYAFFLFVLLAYATIGIVAIRLTYAHLPAARPVALFFARETGIDIILGASMITYLTSAMRRFYHSSLHGALARAAAMYMVIGLLLVGFERLLFYTTLAVL